MRLNVDNVTAGLYPVENEASGTQVRENLQVQFKMVLEWGGRKLWS